MASRNTRRRIAKFYSSIAARWDSVLSYTEKHENYRRWIEDAEECYGFYHGVDDDNPGRFFGVGLRDEPEMIRTNPFKVTVNKVSEFARIVEPELYNRDPVATVLPRRTSPAGADQLSEILEDVLSYYMEMMDTFAERRAAIKDALITGRGIIHNKLLKSPFMPIEEHVSYKDFMCDPDARHYRNITWMARKHQTPKVELIKMFGNKADRFFSNKYTPNELIEWYEIYVKGGIYAGLNNEDTDIELVEKFEDKFGTNVKISLIRAPTAERNNVDYNEHVSKIGPYILDIGDWDIPFYENVEQRNAWPFTLIDLYPKTVTVYPMSPIKPALPEQRAINWAFIFLLNAMLNTSRGIIQLHPDVEEEDIERIKNSMNFSIIAGNEAFQESFKKLSLKQDNSSLWNEFFMISNMFDMRVGLTDMRSAISGAEARSATATQSKERIANKTVDAFFSVVTRAFTETTRKLAFTLRTLSSTKDIESIVGPEEAMFWEEYHSYYNENPIYDLDVTIWADGMRRPNRSQMAQESFTLFETAAQIGGQLQDIDIINHYWANLHKKLGIPPNELRLFALPPQPAPQEMPPQEAAPAQDDAEARAADIISQLPQDVQVTTDE